MANGAGHVVQSAVGIEMERRKQERRFLLLTANDSTNSTQNCPQSRQFEGYFCTHYVPRDWSPVAVWLRAYMPSLKAADGAELPTLGRRLPFSQGALLSCQYRLVP
jgi:hypothetical protein